MGPQGCRNLRTPQPGHSVPLVILDTVARLPLSIPKAYDNEENPYGTTWREGATHLRSGVCGPYRWKGRIRIHRGGTEETRRR